MNKPSTACPVSQGKVNENVSRIIAFFVIIIVSAGVYFRLPLLLVALAIDFYLRTFTSGKYSPLKYISKRISIYFKISKNMTDATPKKFAAGIGLLFTITLGSLLWIHYDTAADSLAAIMLVFAGLEGFKSFCIGCIIYTYIILPFLSKENSEQSTISINL